MFYINEISISSQQYEKKLYDFIFTVKLRTFMKYHSPLPCFPLRNITKDAETHPPFTQYTLYAWCNYWTAPVDY